MFSVTGVLFAWKPKAQRTTAVSRVSLVLQNIIPPPRPMPLPPILLIFRIYSKTCVLVDDTFPLTNDSDPIKTSSPSSKTMTDRDPLDGFPLATYIMVRSPRHKYLQQQATRLLVSRSESNGERKAPPRMATASLHGELRTYVSGITYV